MHYNFKEAQSRLALDERDENGLTPLGLHANQTWNADPKRLAFVLARYKFVAKMLSGRKNVLEVGCGDAFATRIVLSEVEKLTALDFEPEFVKDVNARMDERWQFECLEHDMTRGPLSRDFDAAYSLDVIEHIPKTQELNFVANIYHSIIDDGVVLIGTPSIQSQKYASEGSKLGHVNCKEHSDFRHLMELFFRQVFIFSMNDEVVHTGFYPMAHYLFALCCSRKPKNAIPDIVNK